jgi:delta 1-pyrroline-5-carboxylate dehydrogenase
MVSRLVSAGQMFGGHGLNGHIAGGGDLTSYRSVKTIQQSQTKLFEIEFANATDLLDDLRHQKGIQASTQNVAGTKQAETAAYNLHELGQKLKQLAAQHRV